MLKCFLNFYCSCLIILLIQRGTGKKGQNEKNKSGRMFDLDRKLQKICAGGHNRCFVCNLDALKNYNKRSIHDMNKELIKEELAKNRTLDIVFLGDSITEMWNGRIGGNFKPKFEINKKIFKEHFDESSGGKLNALALGVGGDTVDQLYWRIKHGELPDELNPKVFWVHIGRNNMKGNCLAKDVFAGILQVVEYIRKRKPEATIVVNGILPTSSYKNDIKYKTVNTINWALENNMKLHENVYYVNSLDYFIADQKQDVIDGSLFLGDIHLSVNGYKKWAQSILSWTNKNLVR